MGSDLLHKTRRALLSLLGISLVLGSVGWFARSPLAAAPPSSEKVTLEPLTYEGFRSRLAEAKDKSHKFTIVDVWSTTCGPCKTNFPHLVEMHRKYGTRGLQVVSLSLDDTSDPKAVRAALQFLKDKNAEFLNVLLDEEFGVGFEKLDINTIPAVFLYAPDGKLIKRFTMDDPKNQFTYDDVEKFVTSLLQGKS
ncbi:MAG: hypothetical protein NVSMB9_05000 [Isosphaeraceae bacterium]